MQRPIYMVLNPRALSYARLALSGLLAHSQDNLAVTLITDTSADKAELEAALGDLGVPSRHHARVLAEDDLAAAEEERFVHLPNLRRFRHGHPCWRKITDPVLAGVPGEEMILLDPDLYFPNPFRFEPTPPTGLLLMWQQPNCLLPPQVVRSAMDAQIPLARHVDIGVSHWRISPQLKELEWLDWLVGRLGGASLPRMMHVEAIVWSALAMHLGGGFLDPQYWVCWHRTQLKKLRIRMSAGSAILDSEPWSRMKCFHAGGEAKYWLSEIHATGALTPGLPQVTPGRVLPFGELTPARYNCEQFAKNTIGNLGYYRLFGSATK